MSQAPTREEAEAALTHDYWCDTVQHRECCGRTECDCTVGYVLDTFILHGWVQDSR